MGLLLFSLLLVICSIKGDVCKRKLDKLSFQRADSQTPLSYDPERTKSYCDRIVIGSCPAHELKAEIYEYTAITDEYIDLSDHDLVYGVLDFDGMKILTVTWNVGKFAGKKARKKQSAWDDILCSLKTDFTTKMETKPAADGAPKWSELDIFVFAFQEAKYPFNLRYLTKSLQTSLDETGTHFKAQYREIIAHEGPGIISARNTYLYILYNKGSVYHSKGNTIVQKIIFDQGGGFKKTMKQLIRSKSAVVIGKFQKARSSEKFVVFGNAHLPVDTEDKETWGVQVRELGMYEVEHKFKERFIQNTETDKGVIVFQGDLNFRVVDSGEQFEKYLNDKGVIAESKQNKGFWKELEPPRFLPTCKREVGSWAGQLKQVQDTLKANATPVKKWAARIWEHIKSVGS